MPEATNTPTTARADRYVRAATTIPVTFNQPGPTARSKPRAVTGHLLGTMHARGQVHHYRIEGADGVLYLVPPTWLVAASRAAIAAGVAGAVREYNSRAELLQELAKRRQLEAQGWKFTPVMTVSQGREYRRSGS